MSGKPCKRAEIRFLASGERRFEHFADAIARNRNRSKLFTVAERFRADFLNAFKRKLGNIGFRKRSKTYFFHS